MARMPSARRVAFAVKDCAMIAIATATKAHTLAELRDRLLTVSSDSIYYHFWGGLLHSRFEEREYNNDFASWAHRCLHDARLAERLAVIDPGDARDLEELRQHLIDIIEERMDERTYIPWGPGTQPFEFMRSQLVVFDTHRRMEHPAELAEALPHFSTSSIFYHFIDARRRSPENSDDFRAWISSWGREYDEVVARLAKVDPYFGTLTELRDRLAHQLRNVNEEGVS